MGPLLEREITTKGIPPGMLKCLDQITCTAAEIQYGLPTFTVLSDVIKRANELFGASMVFIHYLGPFVFISFNQHDPPIHV
jgi:hypothetical protein